MFRSIFIIHLILFSDVNSSSWIDQSFAYKFLNSHTYSVGHWVSNPFIEMYRLLFFILASHFHQFESMNALNQLCCLKFHTCLVGCRVSNNESMNSSNWMLCINFHTCSSGCLDLKSYFTMNRWIHRIDYFCLISIHVRLVVGNVKIIFYN